MKEWLKPIQRMGACEEAIKWGEEYDSAGEAWNNCERGDWMLWLCGKLSDKLASRKKLVLTACECARLTLLYVKEGEDRPLKALETAEQWARGENNVTLAMVRTSADAAADAATAAAPERAAYYAAYAAYYAAAAYDATYAAAHAAAYASYAAAASRRVTLKQCADTARKHYPIAPTGKWRSS